MRSATHALAPLPSGIWVASICHKSLEISRSKRLSARGRRGLLPGLPNQTLLAPIIHGFLVVEGLGSAKNALLTGDTAGVEACNIPSRRALPR